MKKIFFIIFTVLSLLTPALHAEGETPFELQGVGIDDKTGSLIDINTHWTDETGTPVQLKKYFNSHKPVVMALVYFGCPNLCTLVLNSLVDSLKEVNLHVGKDFDIVAVSFDPREKSDLSKEKKQSYVESYGRPESAAGWHFLNGDEKTITKLTTQMGFKYKWDNDQKQFAHASTIYVLTPQGKISRMFYGIIYPPKDLKLSLLEAAEGKIGSLMDQLMLFCYHYDATSKKYVILAQKIMRIGGAVFLAVLVLIMAIFWKKEQKK